MSLDLESLKVLDTVVREGGFAKAAERLHKAQSAVSYHVRKLEQSLGLALLTRDGYRAKLTPAGEAVLSEGRRLLVQASQVEALAREFAQGWEPKLTVIIDGILDLEPILAALKQLADAHIPTRIQVKVEYLYGVQYRFDKENADIMLVKDYQPQPNLQAVELPEVECVLVASAQHPLTLLPSVTLNDLQQEIELSVQDSSERGDDRHMFGGERVFFLAGFNTKKQALLMGLGFGWMPRYLIETELASGALKEVAYVGGARYRFTPALVHRRDQPLGRAGQELSRLLRGD